VWFIISKPLKSVGLYVVTCFGNEWLNIHFVKCLWCDWSIKSDTPRQPCLPAQVSDTVTELVLWVMSPPRFPQVPSFHGYPFAAEWSIKASYREPFKPIKGSQTVCRIVKEFFSLLSDTQKRLICCLPFEGEDSLWCQNDPLHLLNPTNNTDLYVNT
jgi:hypothetical protein